MTRPPIPTYTTHLSQDPTAFSSYDWTTVLIISLLAAGVVQQALAWLDYPILSLYELLWNAVVFLIPSRVLFALRPIVGPAKTGTTSTQDDAADKATNHARKSQALREMLRVGSGTRLLAKQREWPAAPKGLGNWDNSCYQNSVLQSIASLPSMHQFFGHVDNALGGCPDQSTLEALRTLANQLNDTGSETSYYWTPAKLKSMSSWQQQDAQEYFSKLIDAMEKDISTELKHLTIKDEAADYSLSDFLTPRSTQRSSSQLDATQKGTDVTGHRAAGSKLASSVQPPFEGLLAQRVGCTECGYTEGLSLIPFNCLTVPLGRLASYELRDCLNEFTELEYIDGVECAKCSLLEAHKRLGVLTESLAAKQPGPVNENDASLSLQLNIAKERTEAVKKALDEEDFSERTLSDRCQIKKNMRKNSRKSRQAAVMRHPNCLVVHINRSMFDEYTGDLLKNYAQVDFPHELDLGGWSVGVNNRTRDAAQWQMSPTQPLVLGETLPAKTVDAQYELKAVITHYGRHENGHYICYRQSPGKEAIDDSSDSRSHEKDTDDQTWWRLSDENVSPVDKADVAAQGNAFMLFYERQNDSQTFPVISSDRSDFSIPASPSSEATASTQPDENASSRNGTWTSSQTTADVEDSDSEQQNRVGIDWGSKSKDGSMLKMKSERSIKPISSTTVS